MQLQSHSISIRPVDHRCRFWAKLVRANQNLPLPSDATGANGIPVPYARLGEEELFPGDCLFEGEANHPRRTDRGWSYSLKTVLPDGGLATFYTGFAAKKAQLKLQGLAAELLTGSGEIAALVRIAHGLRAGFTVTPDKSVKPTCLEIGM